MVSVYKVASEQTIKRQEGGSLERAKRRCLLIMDSTMFEDSTKTSYQLSSKMVKGSGFGFVLQPKELGTL